jgi:biopolymer transport protein ExbD
MNKRRKPEDGPEPTIPVTPMLDMAFQLLAFFVMTYHPSDLEGQMQLALPSSEVKAAHKQENVDTSAAPEKDLTKAIPPEVIVIVETQNKGAISELKVRVDTGDTTIHTSGSNKQDLLASLAALEKQLKETKKALERRLKDQAEKPKEAGAKQLENITAIELQADGRLRWDYVTQVMDACRKAGFENVSLAPLKDSSQGSQ